MRYHGSKWRLAPWIIGHFPSHGRYVEPFGGGASVLMRKKPSAQEVYNDMDGEIVNVFRVLRDESQAERLAGLLALTPHSRAEFELSLEFISPQNNSIESARRTLTRAYMGFGPSATSKHCTGFRTRHDVGGGNLAASWAEYPDIIPAFTRRLLRVTIECKDALQCIAQYDDPETLFYVDPPYLPETRTAHGAQYRYEMTPEQHVELAELLHSVRGMVLLSGYEHPLYRDLYAGWRVDMCASRSEKATPRTEVLWISPQVRRNSQMSLLLSSRGEIKNESINGRKRHSGRA
jgi:DNA adenine methylase